MTQGSQPCGAMAIACRIRATSSMRKRLPGSRNARSLGIERRPRTQKRYHCCPPRTWPAGAIAIKCLIQVSQRRPYCGVITRMRDLDMQSNAAICDMRVPMAILSALTLEILLAMSTSRSEVANDCCSVGTTVACYQISALHSYSLLALQRCD